MKLQFNTRGAWKDVLTLPDEFGDSDIAVEAVADAAVNLLDACSSKANIRIVDDRIVVLIHDEFGRKMYPFGRP